MQLIFFNMQLIYLDNRDTYVNIKHIHVNLMHMDVLMLLVNNTKLHVSQIAERSIVLKMINTNRVFFRLLTNIGIGSHKAKKAASIYSINCRTAGYRMSKNTMARCPDTHNWLKYSFGSMAGCKAGMSVWLDCLYVLNVRSWRVYMGPKTIYSNKQSQDTVGLLKCTYSLRQDILLSIDALQKYTPYLLAIKHSLR